jgi:hypothetical protein
MLEFIILVVSEVQSFLPFPLSEMYGGIRGMVMHVCLVECFPIHGLTPQKV